jgi:DNA-binding MarR family transcriptional regulator
LIYNLAYFYFKLQTQAMTSNWYFVQNSEAADALLRPATFRLFVAFLGVERNLSDAAKTLNVPSSSLKYHVDKFIKWGLLEVKRTQSRRGKSIKFYQAVSNRFFIPFAKTSMQDLETLMQFMQAELQDQFTQDLVRAGLKLNPEAALGGTCIHLLENQRFSLDFSPTPPSDWQEPSFGFAPLWTSWTTVFLSPEEAQTLHDELQRLWQRLLETNSQAKANTRAFTLRLGLTSQET